jgi:hypothetical protein
MRSTGPFAAYVALATVFIHGCAETEAPKPLVELDHVYVVVPDYQDASRRLAEAGITLDTGFVSRHEGGGTASVSALFENAYLEILWVEPTVPLEEGNRSEVEELARAAAWSEGGPSPFGVGLRRTAGAPDSLPYSGDRETTEWAEPGTFFFSFHTSSDAEPSIFVVPEYMALPTWIGQAHDEDPSLLDHGLGVSQITGVIIGTGSPPAAAEEIELPVLEFNQSALPVMELVFDGGHQNTTLDLRPGLPLILRY